MINHQSEAAGAITRMAKIQYKIRRMARKFTPARFRQKLSVEEPLRARNQVEDECEPGSRRLGVPPAVKVLCPDTFQNYFLLGGGAVFRSAADFCNSVTAEAFSS